MSLTQRVKQGFLRLPLMKKAILVSGAGLMLSTVMPWYDTRNSFGIGETYLGIQGPLFVIGALVLVCGAVSFSNIFFSLMGRKFFNLKKRGGTTSLILGAQSLLFVLMGNVIFYNPEFGTDVGSKTTRFGMVVAFVSIGTMIIAGWLARKKENEEEDDVEDIMSDVMPVEAPVSHAMPSYSVPISSTPVTPSYQMPARPASAYQQSSFTTPVAPVAPAGVDPLTLDARTRYKMMQSQGRYSSNAKTNLWGSGRGSAFSRPVDETQDMDI